MGLGRSHFVRYHIRGSSAVSGYHRSRRLSGSGLGCGSLIGYIVIISIVIRYYDTIIISGLILLLIAILFRYRHTIAHALSVTIHTVFHSKKNESTTIPDPENKL